MNEIFFLTTVPDSFYEAAMAHDASHHPNVSGDDPQDRTAGGGVRHDARTILLLVLGVLLFALGHPTKGAEVARILRRFRKRHLDLIVGRVMGGIRLAEELDRQDAERRAAEDWTASAASSEKRVARPVVTERRAVVVRPTTHRRRRFAARPDVRRKEFHPTVSRGPPRSLALAA